MPHFPRPADGWTKQYPGLGTEPVSYVDSFDPEHYQREVETIFMKEWLNVGRIEQVPRVGSFFTKELHFAKRSVVISRTADDTISAYYNVCPHRGNKLVWNDFPREETSGFSRQFQCKYHGWRFDLDGSVAYVQQESEFFDLDLTTLGLKPVHCAVWEGFIFINLADAPAQSLTDALGPYVEGLKGYPFGEMTQTYEVKSDVNANWKLFIDAFVEFYHAPVLHRAQANQQEGDRLFNAGFEGLHYELFSPHAMVSSWGGIAPPKHPSMVKPIENILKGGLFGPWKKPDIIGGKGKLAPMLNPSNSPVWGLDSFIVWPNFMILIWEPGWYMTYNYWPTGPNSHIFESTLNFVPPRDPQERVAQEFTFSSIKEYVFQDANTLEATQSCIESGVIQTFVLNDQEILCRHHHKAAQLQVDTGGRPTSYPWMPTTAPKG